MTSIGGEFGGGESQGREIGKMILQLRKKRRRHVLLDIDTQRDFLLAGVLSVLHEQKLTTALEVGIKVASARIAGWTEKKSWPEVENKIKVEIHSR